MLGVCVIRLDKVNSRSSPIYIKDTKVILVTGGVPQLHKEAFVALVRLLYQTNDPAGFGMAA